MELSFIVREKVQEAWLYSGKTQQEIAREFDVSERTIRYWIKRFKWAEHKHRMQHPPSTLTEGINLQLTNLQNMILASDRGVATLEQAIIMQKLVLCLIRLNEEPVLNNTAALLPADADDIVIDAELEEDNAAVQLPVSEKNNTPVLAATGQSSATQTIENDTVQQKNTLPVGGNQPAITHSKSS